MDHSLLGTKARESSGSRQARMARLHHLRPLLGSVEHPALCSMVVAPLTTNPLCWKVPGCRGLNFVATLLLTCPHPLPPTELGIDIAGILCKTRAVLFHRLNSKHLEDLDMGGALLFVFLLGGLHLLVSTPLTFLQPVFMITLFYFPRYCCSCRRASCTLASFSGGALCTQQRCGSSSTSLRGRGMAEAKAGGWTCTASAVSSATAWVRVACSLHACALGPYSRQNACIYDVYGKL
jgi:hypothetical protein